MITEAISTFAIKVLDTAGPVGAGALMALESMIAPVPSEAVMPFVGFQVADGKWAIGWAILATSAGSVLGSLVSYLMGYYGGKPFVLKAGRFLLLNRHDLELTEQFFHRRQGLWTVFIARFIPVVRHFISIPAGIGRMPIGQFSLVTLLGATLWNTFLLLCGMRLRTHWQVVLGYSHQVDLIIGGMLVVGGAWFVRSRWRTRRTRPALHD
jgi:membrane protein DedA with SNARE-associated domain